MHFLDFDLVANELLNLFARVLVFVRILERLQTFEKYFRSLDVVLQFN